MGHKQHARQIDKKADMEQGLVSWVHARPFQVGLQLALGTTESNTTWLTCFGDSFCHRYCWRSTRLRVNVIFFLSMGSKSGFSCDQNSHDSSGTYVTCIYYGLGVKMNMWKVAWHTQVCSRLFLSVWSARTRIPLIGAPWLTMPLHRWV